MQRRFMIISASSLLMIFVLSAVTTVTALAQKPSINISHRFIESRNLGQGKVRNVWRVDWTAPGSLPFGATEFSRFEVSVTHLGGIGRTTVNGRARTATVNVEIDLSRSIGGPAVSRPSIAEVIGFVSCDKVISYKPSGTTVSGACPIQMSFSSTPGIVHSSGASSSPPPISGPSQPAPGLGELGVKVSWNVNGTISIIQAFNLTAIVKFTNQVERQPVTTALPPGQRPDFKPPILDTRSFSAGVGAEARTKTISIGKVSLVNNAATIEEVKVKMIAETKFSGRNEVAH